MHDVISRIQAGPNVSPTLYVDGDNLCRPAATANIQIRRCAGYDGPSRDGTKRARQRLRPPNESANPLITFYLRRLGRLE